MYNPKKAKHKYDNVLRNKFKESKWSNLKTVMEPRMEQQMKKI